VSRPALEVADIFRDHGAAWRSANAGHVSLDQMKVMSAIERCRTVALGGHVARCENCADTVIAYNSCRNRHCPKCRAAAAKQWLAEREAELLPAGYFHLVFTLPGPIADIAYHNKAAIYGLLFTAAAETTLTIAADPKRLGAKVRITAVLHSWGSAMTHHPHVHMIVPGGGISLDGTRWVSCRPRFFLPVRVLSRLFRRLFLAKLLAAHQVGRLAFFRDHAALAESRAFAAFLAPLRKTECDWLLGPQSPHLLRVNKSPHRHTTKPLRQCLLRSFRLSPTHILPGTAMGRAIRSNLARPDDAAKSPQSPSHRRRPHSPRFRALALFRRRPPSLWPALS
jgi:Transposase zinc-binding domain/Putative transposase